MPSDQRPSQNERHVEVGALILLANLGVLGLTLKLYTEYFKDKSQESRRG